MLKKKLLVLMFFLLTSCSSKKGIWYKENSTSEERHMVFYRCLVKSQQKSHPSSWHYETLFSSDSIMVTNDEILHACMNAHGFFWQRDPAIQKTRGSNKKIDEKIDENPKEKINENDNKKIDEKFQNTEPVNLEKI